MYFLLIN